MGLAIRKMIELKYVPVCDQTLCWLFDRAHNGKSILDTNRLSASGGCPPIASLDELTAITEKMEEQSGRITSKEDREEEVAK